jgi:quinol monooxygenase YgiN
MPKVLLQINYEVQPAKREEYLNLIKELKSGYDASGIAKLEIYEVQGSPNDFVEIYTYETEEAFQNADDSAFDETVAKINDCLVPGRPDKLRSYTLHQI